MSNPYLKELEKLGPPPKFFKLLVIGESGSGKSRSLATLPGKTLVHSFDPDGAMSYWDAVEEGKITVDYRFEREDPSNPRMFKAWMDTYKMMTNQADPIWNHFDNYVLDTLTTMDDCIMANILHTTAFDSSGKPVRVAKGISKEMRMPELQHYGNENKSIIFVLRKILCMPMNIIVIGHIGKVVDEITQRTMLLPSLTKGAANAAPVSFSEFYIAKKLTRKEKNPDGTPVFDYVFQTGNDKNSNTRSRSRRPGSKIPSVLPQDFRKIFDAFGYEYKK